MDGVGDSSTVRRILLGSTLRRLREAKGVSMREAGYHIRNTESKISRMETGKVSFKERDVQDLLTLYGVGPGKERDQVLDLVREANTLGWWHAFSEVLPDWFEAYVGLEAARPVVRTYEVQFIPGLLQSPDYMRAIVSSNRSLSGAEIARRVELRTRRQNVLDREEDPLVLWAVLDEAALRRPVGGADVMRRQVEFLIEQAAAAQRHHPDPAVLGRRARCRGRRLHHAALCRAGPGGRRLPGTPDQRAVHRAARRRGVLQPRDGPDFGGRAAAGHHRTRLGAVARQALTPGPAIPIPSEIAFALLSEREWSSLGIGARGVAGYRARLEPACGAGLNTAVVAGSPPSTASASSSAAAVHVVFSPARPPRRRRRTRSSRARPRRAGAGCRPAASAPRPGAPPATARSPTRSSPRR